jgi:hypothetical protein
MKKHYEKDYIERVVSNVFNPRISFLLIVILIGLLSNQFLTSLFVSSALFVIVIISSIINNIYLLKEIAIDETDRILKYSIIKYNKPYKTVECKVDDIVISIKSNRIIYRSFVMVIKHKDFIYKQNTLGGWNTSEFIEVVKKLNDLKQLPTFVDWVKR